MSIRNLLIAAALLALLAAHAHAQHAPMPSHGGGAPPGQRVQPGTAPQATAAIVGIVTDEGGRPIGAASVVVTDLRDTSAIANGALTGADGRFHVAGLAQSHYAVEIRAIGYAPVKRPNVPVRQGAQVELGTIAMKATAVQLSEQRVTAEQDVVTLAPDRNSYTVKDMPLASGGTAADVLRTVPGIEVDGDNRISLRGNQNVVVQINGRASPMKGEQLGNFLAQLSSNVVQRVEVIASPSARQDPEGLGGIINLVLRQQADLGTSGGIVLGGGSTKMANASGNLGHQAGKLSVLGTLDFMRDERGMTGTTTRYDAEADAPWLETSHIGTMFPSSQTATGQLEYRLHPTDVLSANLLLTRRTFDRENSNRYSVLDAGRTTVDRFDRLGTVDLDELTADLALGIKRTKEASRNESGIELRALRWNADVASDQSMQPLQPSGLPDGDPSRDLEETSDRRNELIAQADLVRPLGARAKIETGYKGIFRSLDGDRAVAVWRADEERFEDIPSHATAFDYRDRIHAAYAVVSSAFGRLNAQAGLRAEQAETRFDVGAAGRFDDDYRSLYPSAILSFDATSRRQLKVGYSKRVQRPETRMLNPVDRPHEDRTNIFRGNPYLRPEYTHAFELGWQEAFEKGSLQLTPFFRRTVDAMRLTRFIDSTGATISTLANLESSDSWGVDANGSFRAGRLSGFGGASAFRVVSDATNLERDVSVESFAWSARANGTFKVTSQLDAQGFVMYRAPTTTETGRALGQTFVNFALRHKVAGERGAVTLRIQDPFRTMRFGSDQTDGAVTQTSVRRFGMRGAVVTFSYNFGQAPRLRPRAVEQQAEPGM